MSGLNPNVAVHQVAVKNGARLVKQAQRRFRPDLVPLIENEANKLNEAGFIREVKYPTWISSIILVRKKNGQIRIELRKLIPLHKELEHQGILLRPKIIPRTQQSPQNFNPSIRIPNLWEKNRRNMGRIERWVVKQERIMVRNENQMHAVVAIAQKYPKFSAIVQIIGPTWRRFSIETQVKALHKFVDIPQECTIWSKQSFEKSKFMEREMSSRCYSTSAGEGYTFCTLVWRRQVGNMSKTIEEVSDG
ncbi:hypothetical protein H5410_046245 [Solanum commersonii]|uniref:Reverse transcriptase domain-containing protein n=1 Tax=Solanum commersonii TaxID=4109 RepID=A0A9J5XBQ7_SOLCO|nr:hypothetical protein H5410_046245 [Solanum commersonii]